MSTINQQHRSTVTALAIPLRAESPVLFDDYSSTYSNQDNRLMVPDSDTEDMDMDMDSTDVIYPTPPTTPVTGTTTMERSCPSFKSRTRPSIRRSLFVDNDDTERITEAASSLSNIVAYGTMTQMPMRCAEDEVPNGACIICNNANVATLFRPCNHAVTCMSCVHQLATFVKNSDYVKCPCCKTDATSIERIYIA